MTYWYTPYQDILEPTYLIYYNIYFPTYYNHLSMAYPPWPPWPSCRATGIFATALRSHRPRYTSCS